MRVVVLGGTRFIGRTIVEALVAAGHEPLICHRGETEPDGLPTVAHLHADRADLAQHRDRLDAFAATGVVDCRALTASDARAALAALPDPSLHWVVLSSQDVYRAFATLQRDGLATDAVPIDEDAPLRPDRYPYPERPGLERYSKIDVEEIVLDAGATVLRLPMTYGPHDYQRREEWVLRRVRAGRRQLPVGVANAVLPLAFVGDVAQGVVSALEHRIGGVYNLVAASTDPLAVWVRRILAAAGSDIEVVRVPDNTTLPEDLEITAAVSQPLVISSAKARRELAYRDTDADEAIDRSVRWHLAHPPADASEDFSADDLALAAASA
jgi:nucleoside-diphosphate-sugar epimerase